MSNRPSYMPPLDHDQIRGVSLLLELDQLEAKITAVINDWYALPPSLRTEDQFLKMCQRAFTEPMH